MRWLKDDAPQCDVVVSTRIRLARNMADVVFPSRITLPDDIEKVHAAAKRCLLVSPDFTFTHLLELNEIDRRALIESHIISSNHAASKNGALIANNDQSISVMILEEDHFRIQSLGSGLSLVDTYDTADRIDNMLSGGISFAFDEKLGFLTSCPTNVGTGLRASLMLHLPALTAAKGMQRIAAMISKVGMTVRGALGEGSKPAGSFYQFSNQVTLGVSEKEILSRLLSTVNKVIDFERNTRRELHANLGLLLEDRIWRAIGILKYARRIGDSEAQKLISDVALGVSLGIVPGMTSGQLYKLMMNTRPATIAQMSGYAKPHERDAVRAEMLRNIFS